MVGEVLDESLLKSFFDVLDTLLTRASLFETFFQIHLDASL